MDPVHVVPRAHHNVESGGAGDPGQCQGIPLDAHGGRVDDCSSTRALEVHSLRYGHVLVRGHQVVIAPEGVVADPAEVIHGHRLVGLKPLACPGRRVENQCEVQKEMLVGARRPQGLGRNRPQYGLCHP